MDPIRGARAIHTRERAPRANRDLYLRRIDIDTDLDLDIDIDIDIDIDTDIDIDIDTDIDIDIDIAMDVDDRVVRARSMLHRPSSFRGARFFLKRGSCPD